MSQSPFIVDVSRENFNAAVVERSRQTPVLIEFYAEEAPQSRELAAVLRRLAERYQGKFILARVDIVSNAPLVQQLGVRTLPSLKLIVDGQIAQNLEGPQDEARLTRLLDQVTMSPIEQVRDQINVMISEGDREGAIGMLQQAIAEEPSNFGLHTELCDLLIMVGREKEAREILDALPKDAEGINKPRHRLEFIDLTRELPPLKKLSAQLEKSPDNLQYRFDLAVAQVVDDQMDEALENLMFILQKDRGFQDDVARKTMIKVFDLLGKGNPLATEYRRKMFNFMH